MKGSAVTRPPTMYGAGAHEGTPRRYGSVSRVAVLSDVHANVPALEAVLAEVDAYAPDLVVFNGDLTWGAEPERTLELVAALGDRPVFIRGNGERAALELARSNRAGTAYWATLGPDVRLRQTRYDVAEALGRGALVNDPGATTIATLLSHPPTPAEIMEDAESRVFAD
jgi:Calcineurin-like phosphoesterase superfamily domain